VFPVLIRSTIASANPIVGVISQAPLTGIISTCLKDITMTRVHGNVDGKTKLAMESGQGFSLTMKQPGTPTFPRADPKITTILKFYVLLLTCGAFALT